MKSSSFLSRLANHCMAAALTFVLGACGGGGGGGGGYSGPVWTPTDVMIADVDGDGRADVLTLAMVSDAGHREGHLLVYRQTAPGTFAAPLTTIVGSYPERLALGDINGDGRPDVVIADGDARIVWLLLQDATRPGQFLAPQALFSGQGYNDAVIADLNHDGVPDVAASAGSSVRIRYQDPLVRGSFGAEVSVPLPGGSGSLVAGDVDGDGLTDLLTWVYTSPASARPETGGLIVLFQQPGGGFVDSGVLAAQTGMNVGRLAIADANGDGRRDLFAFLTPSSADYTPKLVVVPQTTARGFGATVTTSLLNDGMETDDVVLLDLNQNGVPDAAAAGFVPETYSVRPVINLLSNNGNGAFVRSAMIENTLELGVLTAGDIDGDGRIDIVQYGGEQCLVMFQSTTPGTFLAPRPLR